MGDTVCCEAMKNYHEIIESEVWKDYTCRLNYPVSRKQSLARFNIGRLEMALMQRFGMEKTDWSERISYYAAKTF